MAVRQAKSGISSRMSVKVKTESEPVVGKRKEGPQSPRKIAIPDLVKKDGQQYNEDLQSQIEHLSRLAKITGMDYGRGIKLEVMKKLQEKGFVWFVNHEFVEKFEHAAAMTPPKGNANCSVRQNVRHNGHTDVRFNGDVPDWVIDRMELALDCGMDTITVHSHYPLPVKLEKIETDPVAVAWKGTPAIVKDADGKFKMNDHKKQGVVIAIWQGEHELEVI